MVMVSITHYYFASHLSQLSKPFNHNQQSEASIISWTQIDPILSKGHMFHLLFSKGNKFIKLNEEQQRTEFDWISILIFP